MFLALFLRSLSDSLKCLDRVYRDRKERGLVSSVSSVASLMSKGPRASQTPSLGPWRLLLQLLGCNPGIFWVNEVGVRPWLCGQIGSGPHRVFSSCWGSILSTTVPCSVPVPWDPQPDTQQTSVWLGVTCRDSRPVGLRY